MNYFQSLIKSKYNLTLSILLALITIISGINTANAKSNDSKDKSINISYDSIFYIKTPSPNIKKDGFINVLSASTPATDNIRFSVCYGSGTVKLYEYTPEPQKTYVFASNLEYYGEDYFAEAGLELKDQEAINLTKIQTAVGSEYKISDNFYATSKFITKLQLNTIESQQKSDTDHSLTAGPELLVGAEFALASNIKINPEIGIRYEVDLFDVSKTQISTQGNLNIGINCFNFQLGVSSDKKEHYNLNLKFGVKI